MSLTEGSEYLLSTCYWPATLQMRKQTKSEALCLIPTRNVGQLSFKPSSMEHLVSYEICSVVQRQLQTCPHLSSSSLRSQAKITSVWVFWFFKAFPNPQNLFPFAPWFILQFPVSCGPTVPIRGFAPGVGEADTVQRELWFCAAKPISVSAPDKVSQAQKRKTAPSHLHETGESLESQNPNSHKHTLT